ncbi:MAG: glycine cleavage system protein GcvH [Bacilli bacterium]
MSEKKYSPSHEWVTLEGDIATIGITDFAQGSLGTIVFVDLPAVGKTFKENDVFGVVESVKAASDLYIPLSGEILETNQTLVTSPDLINQDAESNWMIKIRISNLAELTNLLSKADYDALPK